MSRLATSSAVTPVRLRDRAQVEDALVRDQPAGPRVEHRVVRREAGGDVVGGEDRDLGGPEQAVAAHQLGCTTYEIGRMPGRAVRARPAMWRRQERGEVRAHRDRADPGPSPTVGDAERLVQVEVRHVGAEPAGLGQPDERVEVGAVEVHLTAALVHDRADVADVRLEHAVGRRVRDHQRGELVRRARAPSS